LIPRFPSKPFPRPRETTRKCEYCGEPHHFDLSCRFCSHMHDARRNIEENHPGEGLPHQNLVKLAGHLSAGIHNAFILAHGRGGFDPTREELNLAAQWAIEEFQGNTYCLREKPNGSMTDIRKPAAVEKSQPEQTEKPGEAK
jgi:hypothetical protein